MYSPSHRRFIKCIKVYFYGVDPFLRLILNRDGKTDREIHKKSRHKKFIPFFTGYSATKSEEENELLFGSN